MGPSGTSGCQDASYAYGTASMCIGEQIRLPVSARRSRDVRRGLDCKSPAVRRHDMPLPVALPN